jgi:hypothetical protein
MLTLLPVAAAFLLLLVARWALFARVRVYHAPFCPRCRESRGRLLGIGEMTSRPYLRCPHCGYVFDGDG